MTRVLALTRYDDTGASSRVRFYQFLPFLESQGFEVEVQPLLDASYVRRLLVGERRSFGNMLACYARRLSRLVSLRRPDVIWLEKELFPWAPSFFDPDLVGSTPMVVDFDDAIFHNYDEHPQPLLRRLYSGKIPRLMRRAKVVVAGNDYLANFARRAGARRVEIIPSVVDGRRYSRKPRGYGVGFTIGWIGSPSTQHFLEPLRETLATIVDPRTDRFVTIGARYDGPMFPGHEILPWTAESEPELLASLDVGVMPLRDAPFERGKCGFKLVQYMACGIPMVASPVGVNREIVRSGETGFLAESTEDWSRFLLLLKHSSDLRAEMGATARTDFEVKYSFETNAPRLAAILRSAMGGGEKG
jgi:glycosyltransferase involved in cell wall biosynthesis